MNSNLKFVEKYLFVKFNTREVQKTALYCFVNTYYRVGLA
jgi:hypothetical protein